jgi:hypothetical protein
MIQKLPDDSFCVRVPAEGQHTAISSAVQWRDREQEWWAVVNK